MIIAMVICKSRFYKSINHERSVLAVFLDIQSAYDMVLAQQSCNEADAQRCNGSDVTVVQFLLTRLLIYGTSQRVPI